MNIPLDKYKKISDSPKAAVLQHPLGHKITIAKNVLSPELKKQVESLRLHMSGTNDPEDSVVPETDEQLAAEAKTLPRKANMQEERQRSVEGYSPDFPTATPVQMAQNNQTDNTPQPQQTEQPPEQPAQPTSPPKSETAPNFFTNGTFDIDKFAIHDPETPVERKIEAIKNLDQKQKQEESYKAYAQQKAQDAYNKAIQYNQLAAQRGLPPVAVPGGVQPNAVADISQEAPVMANQPSQNQSNQEIQNPQGNIYSDQTVASNGIPGTPQIQPNDPYGIRTQLNAQMQGFGEQRQGFQGQAEAEKQIAEANQPTLETGAQSQNQLLQSYHNNLNQLMQEHQAFQSDLQNGHIDPMRVLNSMGSGQKFATGIGLILGGMGGGLTHQGNPALQMLNAQIDRDIDAQKANIGIKENLLSANMKMFPTIAQATEATRAQLAEALKAQMTATANKYQNPLIQSRLQQSIGQLDAEKIAPALRQGAMLGSLSSGAMEDPASKLRMLGMTGIIPQSQQESAFKELATAKADNEVRNNVLNWFNQAASEQTLGHRALTAGMVTPQAVNNLKNELIQVVKQKEGRVTPTETDAIDKLVPEVKDTPDRLKMKLNGLNQFLTEKMHYPQLESLGINPNAQSRFNAQGQKKFQLGAPIPVAGAQ